MLTDAEIAGMRATSTAAQAAEGKIERPSTTTVFNPNTGLLTPAAPTLIYRGAMRVRTLHTQDMAAIVGGLHESLSRYVATVPFDAGDIWVDDFLTIESGTDANLVGRPLRVTDVQYSEVQIDRRLILEHKQQPK